MDSKTQAKSLLKDIWEHYHSFGMMAVYFYGSILRSDYDSYVSDIDSISIVSDEFPLDYEEEIRNKLTKKFPEKKIGFRILYKSELSGGQIKSKKATADSPKWLLLEMPYWELIQGKSFLPVDFMINLPDYDIILSEELQRLGKMKWLEVDKIPVEEQIAFSKKISQIVCIRERQKNYQGPFSYSEISQKSSSLEGHVMRSFLIYKRSGWNPAVFKENMLTFKIFLNSVLVKSHGTPLFQLKNLD